MHDATARAAPLPARQGGIYPANPTRGELNHSSCSNLRLLLPITDLLPCFFQRGSRSWLSATSDAVLCAARALCLQHVSRKQLRKLGQGAGQPWDPEPSQLGLPLPPVRGFWQPKLHSGEQQLFALWDTRMTLGDGRRCRSMQQQ